MDLEVWQSDDVLKPNCPYLPGFTVEIVQHIPPPPFGGPKYSKTIRKPASEDWLRTVTQTEAILTHPPLETPAPSEPPRRAHIAVTKALAVGNARGAQLVECSVRYDQQQPEKVRDLLPSTVVAKIYDSLYYDRANSISGNPTDTAFAADRDYSREAAAYGFLEDKGLTGNFTPRYYGSWTLRWPVPITQSDQTLGQMHRDVRLVLIERLDGTPMRDLFVRNKANDMAVDEDIDDASHLPEEYRLEVAAQVFEGIVRQRHVGLNQGDLAPRNIVIVPSPHQAQILSPSELRVVLIDYNTAVVQEHTVRFHAGVKRERPLNPARWLWSESLPELRGWVPDWWYLDVKRRRQWLYLSFVAQGKGDAYASPDIELDPEAEPIEQYD